MPSSENSSGGVESSSPTIVALVPMRHTSERVPGKNYRDLAGIPLYRHIISTLLDVPAIGQIVIDTDSPVIAQDAEKHFPSVRVIDRPENLRNGSIPMTEVLCHDIDQVQADFYLQTHSTNPLLRSETITRAIELFLKNRSVHDSLFSVTRWQTRLYDAQCRAVNHDPDVLERTQDLDPLFEENSNLYIFSRSVLIETGRRIGRTPLMYEIDRLESIDIDDEDTFLLADALASQSK